MGFTSLSITDLRTRLSRATGLALTAEALFEHATPRALATHLLAGLAGSAGPAAPAGPERADGMAAGPERVDGMARGGTVTHLFRHAFDQEQHERGLDLLDLAAGTRPRFQVHDTGGEGPTGAEPVRLSDGSEAEPLLCVPSLVAPASPYQFARFAQALRGTRDVWVLPTPGCGPGEALPADLDATAVRQADAVLRAFGDKPLTLVAYSSGAGSPTPSPRDWRRREHRRARWSCWTLPRAPTTTSHWAWRPPRTG
ncbi:phosphopantetheine-binding protein [Streptomyces sp. RTd22]|uniref:phosphopantetheine-binding protein n=1 Tax=Streptomyces sp. RTd22 TaxID=1841249 RepID=UPI003B633D67